MRSRRNRLRTFLSARNFTLAIVMVNVAGFVLVQQKMAGAQVDDAYALDDGVEPFTFARAELPERLVLPEIALTAAVPDQAAVELAEASQLPPVQLELDLADIVPVSDPLPVYKAGREQRNAFAIATPAAKTAKPIDVEPEVKLTRVDRIPTPSAAGAAPTAKAPVLVETLPAPARQGSPQLTQAQAGFDTFSAAFGASSEVQAAPVETAPLAATATGNMALDLDAAAPVTQAPVFDLPQSAEPAGTVKLPAPTAFELPQIKPIVPFAETTQILPSSV